MRDGWAGFRGYHSELWRHLAAAHRCPFLWSTATCSERLLEEIAEAYEVPREEMAVLVMSPDTPNVYQQRRIIKSALSIG